jgi:hypothetical protein
VELMFRLTPLDKLKNQAALDPEDYARVGELIPISEFETPFNIYETFSDRFKEFGLPRPPQRYDVLNICTYEPEHGVTSLMLVDLSKGDKTLPDPTARLHRKPNRPLALLPLVNSFPFNGNS